MEAVRIETTLQADGVLTLSGLPFEAGKQVEVIVLEVGSQATTTNAASFDEASTHPFQGQRGVYLQDPFAPTISDAPPEQDRYPLRGMPYTYIDPFEPAVPPEDWEALQ